jgi:two-component system CheB/CheR fusion protein
MKTKSKKPAGGRGDAPQTRSAPPVVGIGASAGGLEAVSQLLRALPLDTGMAFVLVQHLEARHESVLAKLLSGVTRMGIFEAKNAMPVQPNRMYVIPPNSDISIAGGVLRLDRRKAPAGRHMPIDHFFRSLAEDQGARAIGVILSGTASDGTLGLKSIKAEGGITFAQEPESAKYGGMPQSAIAAGCVDIVLTPERIARELSQISRHPYVGLAPQQDAVPLLAAGEEELGRILELLRSASGVDFTYYKKPTIKRRVARRMALHNMESLSRYLKHLEGNRQELDALYQDILIHVTSFFREPEVFLALQGAILPKISAGKPKGEAFRIWVPGCSSGEEVYSIAMCLLENLGDQTGATPIQIFGTDVSEKEIEYARAGIYRESALQEVSEARLSRFFTRSDKHAYRVNGLIRDLCIFARHDLIGDPPFSRMDLISCRNVLIYLEPVLQRRALTSLHYALNEKGFLMLGRSETLGGYPELFAIVDRKNKFFMKKPAANGVAYALGSSAYERLTPPAVWTPEAAPAYDFEKEADRVVWERYAHAGFVVDQELRIVLVRGDTSPYLRPAPGKPTLNLLGMLREDLILETRVAIQKVQRAGSAVRREAIRVKQHDRFREVCIEVRPLAGPSARAPYLLVLFESEGPLAEPQPESPAAGRKAKRQDRELLRLSEELKRTKEYLQAIIQEQEATNEELKSANEEALSSMEELQSSNEELETAKEELQSSNEELVTLNEQAQSRNANLAQLSDDLANVLAGTNIPILLLERDHRLRRANPTAEKLLHLLPGDVGRPIGDIRLHIDAPDLEELISEVIHQEKELRRDVTSRDGRWYSMRIHPFRTRERGIDGVLLTFVDIHDLYQSREALRREKNVVAAILEAASRALLVVILDRASRIVHFNLACQELSGYSLEEVKERPCEFLLLKAEMDRVKASFKKLVTGKPGQDQFHWVAKDGRRRLISWFNSVTFAADGSVEYVICTGIDITEQSEAKRHAQQSDSTLRALLESASQAILAVGRDGRLALVNSAAETMFGYQRRELIGRKVETLIPKGRRKQHEGHRAGFFQSPLTRPMGAGIELAGLRKNGAQFPVEIGLSHIETRDGTLAVAFVTDITERKKDRDALRESEARLRALTSGLLTAQEEEAKRLSRELHDDLNQRMAMLAVGVAELEAGLPESARVIRDHLLRLEAGLTEVSNAMRRTAYQLHPSGLEHLGLVAALEAYCEDVSKHGVLKVRFKRQDVPEQIPEAVALCLYRIAQESLRNAVKHSRASIASVALSGKDAELILTISDPGQGFDQHEAKAKGGLGLVSMEERVRLVNGTLSIKTRPGNGTHVMVQVPLNKDSQ